MEDSMLCMHVELHDGILCMHNGKLCMHDAMLDATCRHVGNVVHIKFDTVQPPDPNTVYISILKATTASYESCSLIPRLQEAL